VGLHSTPVEGAATRRRQPQGLGEWPQPAPPPPLRLQPPAPLQGADTKNDRCGPAGTANVLRGAPAPSVRSGAERVECSHRCCPSAPSVAPGHLPAPPPPEGAAAESSSPRAATRRGARDGCGDGAVRRRAGGNDDDGHRGLCDPTQESGPAAALASTQPCEGHERPQLTPMPVSCCWWSCPTFLLLPVAPVRVPASAPPPLCARVAAPARPPRPPTARGKGTGEGRDPCRKARRDGGRAAEREKEGPPLSRPTPRLLVRTLPQPRRPRCPCPVASAPLVSAAPRPLAP